MGRVKKLNLIDLILLLTVVTFVILAANKLIKGSQVSLFRKSEELTFREFLKENTGRSLELPCDYNLFFLISPLDCPSCSQYFISRDFINHLKKIGIEKGLSVCVSYVLTGDYSEKEKLAFISEIQNEINVYIDKTNMTKTFLLKKFNTIRTPFLIILTSKGEIKFYKNFEPDERYGYRDVDTNLYHLLEEIL